MRIRVDLYVLVVAVFVSTLFGHGQQASSTACGPPPIVHLNAQPNIFSEQQEEWLGDAMADWIEREYRLADDGAQSAYLQAITDRLAATIPETHLHFRTQVIDSSEVNGFSMAGGRIYITRKLAASAQSDDELASVIGHEMGHIASHQFAFETTADLRRLLGITSVGNRADIYGKFGQLVDARMRDKHPSPGGDTDSKQDEADKIGVYVIAAAGYRPQASGEFWDRMLFTQGKSGGRFADLFGYSKPNERRLGRIRKLVAALPAGCGGTAPVQSTGFADWHRIVVENRKNTEVHTYGTKEVKLTPTLHMDLDRIQFSPDGKLLLAQDQSSVYAISREKMSVLFRADAENALPAQFSPDSQHIVFATQGLHTETWSIAEKKLLEAHEPRTPNHCLQAKISPDGRTVSCLQQNSESGALDLSLLDSESGTVLWSKKHFFDPSIYFTVMMILHNGEEWVGDLVPSSFSPDGNYLLIGPGDAKVAFDLRSRAPVTIGYDLKNVTGSYAFLGNDRVAGINARDARDSGIYSFPEGKRLLKATLPFEKIRSLSSTDGSAFVATSGDKELRWKVADVKAGHFVFGTRTDALDMRNGDIASESGDGSVTLLKLENEKIGETHKIQLPISPLAAPQAATLSQDGKYLAMSTRMHGGIWEVASGKRLYITPGFSRAGWDNDDKLFLEFPKDGDTARHIKQLDFASSGVTTLKYTVDDRNHLRYGLLIEVKDQGKAGTDVILHNPADNSVRWTKSFRDGEPAFTASAGAHDLLFALPLQSKEAKNRMKSDGTLAGEAAAVKAKDNGRLVMIVDTASGDVKAEVVLERPPDYAGVDGMNRVGDVLYVTGEENRTLAYSLHDAKEMWKANGNLVTADVMSRRVCFQNRRDEIIVYDESGKELNHVRLGTPIRFASFLDDGRKLMLLGADEVLRTMDVPAESGKS